jgi:hypothetical protein
MAKALPFSAHLSNLEGAVPSITDACKAIAERAAMLADKEGKRQAPQEALAALAILRELKKVVEAAEKGTADAFKAHVEAGGPIEQGEYALTITKQNQVRVPWEEVAASAARSLCEAQGRTFSQEMWKNTLRDATPPTPVVILKVVKVAGATSTPAM